MKITVEISDSDLKEVCRITGVHKKGPAIRKLVADALLMKERAAMVQKFIQGKWGVRLDGYEESRRNDKRKSKALENRWRTGKN